MTTPNAAAPAAPATPAAASPAAPAPAAAPSAAPTSAPPAAANTSASPDGLLAAAVAGKNAPAAPAAPAAPGRPADLPEQFWDGDKATIKADALVKAWKDSRDHIKQLSATQNVPETADKYAFNKPEKLTRDIPKDDPALTLFNKAAHHAKLSQTQYDALAGHFLMGIDAMVPPALDLAAEKAKLGPNGDAVIQQVASIGDQFVKSGLWSKDEYDEIIVMGSTAQGIKALHKLFTHYGEKPIPLEGAHVEGLPSMEELYDLVATEKYQSDPAERARVDALFEKVVGNAPQSSSPSGLGMRRPKLRGKAAAA